MPDFPDCIYQARQIKATWNKRSCNNEVQVAFTAEDQRCEHRAETQWVIPIW